MTITISPINVAPDNGVYDLGSNTTNNIVTETTSSGSAASFAVFWTDAGNDTFNFTADLAHGTHIIYAGSGADTVNGGGGIETVYDGAGADISHLGGGNDALFAGSGNDTYDGGAGTKDTIKFYYAPDTTDRGDTTVKINTIGVTVNLSKLTAQTTVFGTDIIRGFENATGGNGADKLTGSAAANELSGQGGSDTLLGLGGRDTLRAGAGRDTLIGGGGADEINVSGDTSDLRDTVRYLAVSDSTVTAADTIVGFQGGGILITDRIDLSALLGSAKLTYLGTAALTAGAGGQVRWQLVNDPVLAGEKDIAIFVDTDMDAAAEMKIIIDGSSSGLTHLVKGDFIL